METSTVKQPLFTNKSLIALAVPIIIEAVLGIFAGIADSTMVSSAGEAAVSGISLVDQIFILLVVLFSAIASGGVVVTAQYIGDRNIQKAKSSARQLLYATTAIALVTTLSVIGFIPQILRFIYGELEPEVMENAQVYFFYAIIGLPFLAVASSCTALLRTMARSKLALMLSFGANVLNVAGNAVLIFGFKLGAAGAAIATTFCRIVWATVAMIILHNRKLPVHFENLLKFQMDWDVMGRVMKIGTANGLENGLFQVGKLLVARLVSTFGAVYIAANYVANVLNNFGWVIVGSLGTVLLTVVGQCIGAREPEQAKAYTKRFLYLSHGMSLILFGLVFLLRKQLVQMFDFEPEVLEICAYYLGAAALFTIISFYGSAFVPVAAFRAAGDVRYAVILAVSSMFTFRVGLSYLLNHLFELGLLSVWIGMWADWFFRTIMNTIHFRQGKWMYKRVI